ncbi:MAG: hypothetical protein ABR530_01150 [Pyrinomonadaceae bacterium]
MSNKTIAKFWLVVISVTGIVGFTDSCALVSTRGGLPRGGSRFSQPQVIGTITSPEITESSGVAASKCQNGVLWTHNDSGDGAFIYALNTSGESLGTWRVEGAENVDWEDISLSRDGSGKCFIYIGEIGDNKSRRQNHAIYRVAEPHITPAAATSTKGQPLSTQPAESLEFTYPDYNQDAETLMVHPQLGTLFVITKRVSGPAAVYRLDPIFSRSTAQTAQKVADVSVPAIPNGAITGGDVSPDGRNLVLCDYRQAYEFTLPMGDDNFDAIWKQTPTTINLGTRKSGEAIGYSLDGTSVFATSESRNSPLIQVKRVE